MAEGEAAEHEAAAEACAGGLVTTESCPLPVVEEARRRGWRVEFSLPEGKSATGARVVRPVAEEEGGLLAAGTAEGGEESGKGRGQQQQQEQEQQEQHNQQLLQRQSRMTLVWRNSRFTKSEFLGAQVGFRLNHFPHSSVITRKDALVRGLRKMRAVHGKIYSFFPQAFILPSEYTKFVAQYARDEEAEEQAVWICKPSDSSRGRKIFLIKSLTELHYDQQFVIQKYVPNPLTIGGYKVDLRVYVLVTSVHPLRIYMYRNGLARFGTEKYDKDMREIGNLYAHLTNTSINKLSGTFEDVKDVIGSGCKWDFKQLREWFAAHCGVSGAFDLLWSRIGDVAMLTLLTTLRERDSDPTGSFFELFGFDVLVDEQLKPWLLEVNCAPALSIDSETDRRVKEPLIRDLFTLLQSERVARDRVDPPNCEGNERVERQTSSSPSLGKRALKASAAPSRLPPIAKPTGRAGRPGKGVASSLLRATPRRPSPSFAGQRARLRGRGAGAAVVAERGGAGREAVVLGGFERVFPFDEESMDAAHRILVDGNRAGRSSQSFTDNVRAMVQQIKKRRREQHQNQRRQRQQQGQQQSES